MPYRVASQPQNLRYLDVATQGMSIAGWYVGAAVWVAWAVLLGALAQHPRLPEQLDRAGLAGTLALLGFVPALFAAHRASLRTRERLGLSPAGISAAGELVIDFTRPLDACVVEVDHEQALLVRQDTTWLILYGARISDALGGPMSWGPRWHRAACERFAHRAAELQPGCIWTASWSVRGTGDATVVGCVEAGEELAALAEAIRDQAERSGSALLVVPTAHAEHPVARIDRQGVLSAFGERIDTTEPFDRTIVGALGSEPIAGTDAIVLQQGDAGVCLSLSKRPGGWPSLGALPAAAPELPSVELDARHVLSPAALAALTACIEARATPGSSASLAAK